jgi:hypothetical protein
MASIKKPAEKQDEGIKSELIRRFKANPFLFLGTVFILLITIVAFVFVPAFSGVSERELTDLTFGYYDKTPISYVQDNYFYQVQQMVAQQYQSNINETNYSFVQFQIWRQAFEMAAVRAGILGEMRLANYVAPEDAVDREMALLPEFQENGRFSATRYRKLGKNRQMNLWRQVQENITANHYIRDITELKTSSKESDFVINMAYPQRTFDMAAFPISSYPDSEIIAYAQANPALFRITHLSRITLSSGENDARQIRASIQDGTTTFEDAAKNNSVDAWKENSGDSGSRMAHELFIELPDEAVRETIITLAPGTLSEVIPIGEGRWGFYRAEEAVRPADTSDEAVLSKIRGYVMNNERGRAEDWLIARAEEFIAAAKEKDFDSAIAGKGLEKKNFGPLPVNYGNATLFPAVSSTGLAELSSAGNNENFWRAAFSTPLNTSSEPLVLGDNVVVLYPLEETAETTDDSSYMAAYFSYWLNESTDQSIRGHFMNSGKLKDNFWDVYQKIFGF